MKEELKKFDAKLDKIEEHLSKIDVTLAKQHEQLAHHIYRTQLAENNIELLREEVKPVKKHVALVDSIMKITGAVATAGGLLVALYEAFIAK
jgi:archaellum component FlaC